MTLRSNCAKILGSETAAAADAQVAAMDRQDRGPKNFKKSIAKSGPMRSRTQ